MIYKKRLSFIIPAYNCEVFIDEALNSVLSQLPDDCELIIVDDGSTDGTVKLLKKYEDRYDNIVLSLRSHGGVSAARNVGIDISNGEWIAFMDCDDCLKEGFFEKAFPIKKPEADLYIFSFERIETEDSKDHIIPFEVEDKEYGSVSAFADEYIRTRHLLIYSACNKFYRKSIIDKRGIRFKDKLEFGEDRMFNFDYLRNCGRISTSSTIMFKYMQRNPESASKKSYPDHYNTIMMLHKAKMDCFLSLSEGTSESEKKDFVEYDMRTELKRLNQ